MFAIVDVILQKNKLCDIVNICLVEISFSKNINENPEFIVLMLF